jgi:quinol monooxygenase YgiN
MDDTYSRRALLVSGAIGAALVTVTGTAGAQSVKGLRVVAEIVAKPGSADDLRALLVPFAKGARKEPGCLEYVLMEDQGEAGHFLTYEIWTDRPALDAHMKTPAMAAAGPKLVPLLAKPFTQTFLNALT